MGKKITPKESETNANCGNKRSFIGCIKTIQRGNIYPLFPLLNFIFPVTFLAVSYVLGVTGDHDISRLPYPSDLGERQPERGLFSLSLSIGVATLAPCIVFRFIQINDIGYNSQKESNTYAFVCGMVKMVGQCFVFSYSQVESPTAHFTGATLYFVFGIIYIILQTQLSRKLPQHHPKWLVYMRGSFAIFAGVTFIVFFFGRILAPESESRYYIPQTCEWIIGGIFSLFVLSFSYDFHGLSCASKNMFSDEQKLRDDKI